MKWAVADFQNRRRRWQGELLKENTHTVVMRAPDGKPVIRHKDKHRVVLMEE